MVALSIIMPCYNYGRYLQESLHSILSQTYTDYEVILVDDGSTDETAEIGRAYAHAHKPIRYIANPKNLGIYNACQVGLEAASGEYIHYIGADDRHHPGFLTKSMEMLQNHESVHLVCSIVGYFREGSTSDQVTSTPLIAGCSQNKIFSGSALVQVIRETEFVVPGASSIVKRPLIEQYGGLDVLLENIADWYLFHKIAFSEGIGYIPETLMSMRLHEQTFTNRVKRDKKRRRATFHRLLHNLLYDPPLRQQFLEAGLLDFVFRDLKWRLYTEPKYLCYWKFRMSRLQRPKMMI